MPNLRARARSVVSREVLPTQLGRAAKEESNRRGWVAAASVLAVSSCPRWFSRTSGQSAGDGQDVWTNHKVHGRELQGR